MLAAKDEYVHSYTSCRVECTAVLRGHEDRVWHVAWSPVHPFLLASCGGDRTVRLWYPSEEPLPQRVPSSWSCMVAVQDQHTRTVRQVSWAPTGNRLACASFDATVSIWKVKVGSTYELSLECVLDGPEHEIKSVAWDPSGQLLAMCSRDKSVWIWEESRGEFECAAVLTGHTQDVKRVCWHPDPKRRMLCSASYDETIRVWAEALGSKGGDWVCIQTLQQSSSTIWSVAFARGCDAMAACHDDGSVMLWKLSAPSQTESAAKGQDLWSFGCAVTGIHDGPVYSIDWAPKPIGCAPSLHLVLAASSDNSVSILQVSDSAPIAASLLHKTVSHDTDVNCAAWCNNPLPLQTERSTTLVYATCSDDGTVKVWTCEAEHD